MFGLELQRFAKTLPPIIPFTPGFRNARMRLASTAGVGTQKGGRTRPILAVL